MTVATANGHVAGPTSDLAAIGEALSVLFEPGQPVELRAPKARGRLTLSGYFDDHDALANVAAKQRVNTYVTLNCIDPALLSRRCNRADTADDTTSDANIVRRRWLLVDLDHDRPAGVSATDSEHLASIRLARKIAHWLLDKHDWPEPVIADSGNGAHLLFRIDLANDDDATQLVQRVLTRLSHEFDQPGGVHVDQTVYNAARITKAYGTVARKGDDTPDRPHRVSKLLSVPDPVERVSRELLEAFVGPADPEPRRQPRYSADGQAFDVDAFLARNLEVVSEEPYTNRHGAEHRWRIKTCPLCGETDGSAVVLRFRDGRLGYRCHHNRCNDLGWADLREHFEPGYRDSRAENHASVDRSAGPDRDPAAFEELESWPLPEFLELDHRHEFLIRGLITAGQPGVISAKSKSLKTTIALDAALSIAGGARCLGQWDVDEPKPCGMISGESGGATISESLRRIAAAKGVDPESLGNLQISTSVPNLTTVRGRRQLEAFIRRHELACVFVDPTYLALPGVEESKLAKMAEVLRPVSHLIGETGCTVVMVHHNRKSPAVDGKHYEAPTLSDITGSGFQQWARFWVLLNRRREWDPETGRHWLWYVSGGSFGEGACKWLNVREGRRRDSGGRVWEVELLRPSEGDVAEREAKTAADEAAKLERDLQKLCQALAANPGGLSNTRAMRLSGVSERRWKLVREVALEDGHALECQVTVNRGRQTCDGLKLNTSEEAK